MAQLLIHRYKRRAIVEFSGLRRRIGMLRQIPTVRIAALDATIGTTLLSVQAHPPRSGAILVAAAIADFFALFAGSRRYSAFLPRVQDPALANPRPLPARANFGVKIHIDCFWRVVGNNRKLALSAKAVLPPAVRISRVPNPIVATNPRITSSKIYLM
jgi:hypothetical protein